MRKWRTVRILTNGTVVLIYAVALRVRFFIYLSGLCIKTNVLIKHNKVKRLIAPVSRKSVLLGSVYYYKTLTFYFTLTLIAESLAVWRPCYRRGIFPKTVDISSVCWETEERCGSAAASQISAEEEFIQGRKAECLPSYRDSLCDCPYLREITPGAN